MSFYDQPAQASFINTYVPAPFEEILQAGLARQGRYDETLAALDANQEYLDQLQAIEGEQSAYLGLAKTAFSDIANAYSNKDLSNAYIRRQLRDEIRKKINPTKISNIIESKKNWEKAQQLKAELDMRGLYFEPYERITDPALTGKLTADQVYNYQPRAFQDPAKIAAAYFEAVSPDRRVSADTNTGMVYEITERSLGKLQDAVANNWRSFADTPQGQWVVQQYRQRTGDLKTHEEDITRGYLNDVAKGYATRQVDYVGGMPGYTGKQTGAGRIMPPVAVEGVAEAKASEEYNYRQNRQKIQSLGIQLEQLRSNLRAAAPSKKTAIQKQIDDTQSSIDRLQSIQTGAFQEVGINIRPEDYQRVYQDFDENNSTLSVRERDIAKEVGDMLVKTHLGFLDPTQTTLTGRTKWNILETKMDRGRKAEEYIKGKYPKLDNKTVYNLVDKALSIYDGIRSIEPSAKEKRKAFEGIETSTHHPAWVAPVTRVASGVNYLFNPQTGDYDMPSNTGTVLKGVQSNPERFALSIYNEKAQKWETVNKDRDKEEFNAGKYLQYELLPTLPNEKGEQQLEFRIKDNNDKVSDKLYRISLNDPTQIQAVGADYMNSAASPLDPNFMIGYKLYRSDISSAYTSQGNKDVKVINIQVPSGELQEMLVVRNPDGSQSIQDAVGNIYMTGDQRSNFNTDEEVVDALYELQINNDPSLKPQ